MTFLLSLSMLIVLTAILSYSTTGITIPVAKSEEELYLFVKQLAKEAKGEKRKHLTQQDRNQILSFAGKSNWTDLDVIKIHSVFIKTIETK